MNWKILFDLAQQLGVAVVLIGFFIWRDWKREVSMAITIRTLEMEMRDMLKDLVIKTTKVLTKNAIEMRNICEELLKRPCIAESLAKKIAEEASNA